MNANTLRAVVLLVLTAATGAYGQDLIENVVVRNRLHTVKGRFEVSPTVGMTLVNRLTRHYNFNLGLGYNVSETFAVELRGGYALSGKTGLAQDGATELLKVDPTSQYRERPDLTNLWRMEGNGILGIRWAPIYGKLSLLAELPVHFQTYLWLGGGAAQLRRESMVHCQRVGSREAGICGDVQLDENGEPELVPGTSAFREDRKTSWLGSAAFGFRFFTGGFGALGLELRNYVYPDSYLQGVDRIVAESGGQTGTEVNDGLTHLVMFDLGYTIFF